MLPMLPILVASAWFGIATFVRRRALLVFGLLMGMHLAQAGSYWMVVDAPRARANDQKWSLVDRLADEIRKRHGEVALATSVEQDCHGLWLELDWSYPLRNLEMQFSKRVVWVVEPAGLEPPKGFSVNRVDGSVQLACRNPEKPATQGVSQANAAARQAMNVIAGNP